MKLTQILNNKAHWIFEADSIPNFPPDSSGEPIIVADVTNLPDIAEGWDYDVSTKTFSAPIPIVEPEPQPIKKTTDEQFEELQQQNLILMDAIATLFETIIGG